MNFPLVRLWINSKMQLLLEKSRLYCDGFWFSCESFKGDGQICVWINYLRKDGKEIIFIQCLQDEPLRRSALIDGYLLSNFLGIKNPN